jgi:hypothetical protein
MEAQLHQTREAWLNYVAQRMAPMLGVFGQTDPWNDGFCEDRQKTP